MSALLTRPTEAHKKERFRADIQGLRAIAVGLVVLDHAGVRFLAGGYVGVDVFFVISGFLITGLLLEDAKRNGRVGFRSFYGRRAMRILPAATVVLVVTCIAAVEIMNFVRARGVLTDGVWAAFFLANVHFAAVQTNYFTSGGPTSPIQHFWSLSVEEQFYLVWPALMAVALFGTKAWRRIAPGQGEDVVRRRKRLLRGRLVLVLLAISGVSLYLSVQGTAANPTASYFSTVDRAWELAAGALLATCLPLAERIPERVRVLLTWLGVGGIALAALVYNSSTPFPGSAALLPVLATCAVLAGGIGGPRYGANQLLSRKPMQFVGNISYSLYLWHWPMLILIADAVGHSLDVWQNLAIVGLAVVVSTGSYHWIENPIRFNKRLRTSPRRALVLWPIALTCVVVVATLGQPTSPYETAVARIDVARDAPAAVRAAVLAAERGAAIPSALSPALVNAGTDDEQLGDCTAYMKPSSRLCEIGDPAGKKLMVVFGNSHATMWTPALRIVASQEHWRLIPVAKEACGYDDYVGLTGHNQCTQWYAWALKQIRALHPEVVLVGVYAYRDWAPALLQIVPALEKMATKVILVTDVPALRLAPVDCILQQGATQKTCLFPEFPYRHTAAVTVEQIGRRFGAEVVDVESWFCYQGLCPSVIDSIIPYRDTEHLTATYSRYLAPDLAAALHLNRM